MFYENPYAAVPLPKDLFNGPNDERWGPIENVKPDRYRRQSSKER
jgi:hypothetical protein